MVYRCFIHRTASTSFTWFRYITVTHQETSNTEYPDHKSQEMARPGNRRNMHIGHTYKVET